MLVDLVDEGGDRLGSIPNVDLGSDPDLQQTDRFGGVRTYCATPIAYLEVSGLIVLVDLIDNYRKKR